MADALQSLFTELESALREVRRREAELAANVPVRPLADEEPHLADRLQAVLRCGAESIDCQAAALYLLDAATSELKLRACWGLPPTRLLDKARPLAGAVADLEALAGHAVVLETEALMDHWSVPETAAAAVCVPVSTPSIPLGTLWVFSDKPREFTSRETNLIEVVAGRVAADLERHALLIERLEERGDSRFSARLPATSSCLDAPPGPDVPGWEVVGESLSAGLGAWALHDWFALADGRLAVLALSTGGEEAILHAARAAFRAHAVEASDLSLLSALVDETLWECGRGDWTAEFSIAVIDPLADRVEWAASTEGMLWYYAPEGPAVLRGEEQALGRLSSRSLPARWIQVERHQSVALLAVPPREREVEAKSILPRADEFMTLTSSDISTHTRPAALLTRLRKCLAMRGDDYVTEAGSVVVLQRAE